MKKKKLIKNKKKHWNLDRESKYVGFPSFSPPCRHSMRKHPRINIYDVNDYLWDTYYIYRKGKNDMNICLSDDRR